MNRQDTERAHRWEDKVVKVRHNRTDRRRGGPPHLGRRWSWGGK